MRHEDKIAHLRKELEKEKVDGFLIPRADEYQGEFVPPCAERLKWISGFTGSAGIAIVLKERAVVMSDGRYTIQLERQVDKDIFDTADSTKVSIEDWIADNSDEGDIIGYDPMLHPPKQIQKLIDKGLKLKSVQNLVDRVWFDRPKQPCAPILIFPDKFAGVSLKAKLDKVAKELKKKKAAACILTLPDSICWLLNIRGSDIPCTPAVLAYAIVYADGSPCQLIIDPHRIHEGLRAHFGDLVMPVSGNILEGALDDLSERLPDSNVLLDFTHTPIWFKDACEARNIRLIDAPDPCIRPKSIKNTAEIAALKRAHKIDALALCKFLFWLDTLGAPGKASEVEIGEKIDHFRSESTAYRGESFPAIVGFGSNGAIVHYRATPERFDYVDDENLILIDSGGQYFEMHGIAAGTTDITRTVAVGNPSDEMKERFTLVLKGHINLALAHFPAGTTGAQIDTFARAPLWAAGLDFAHGTGHGVGCYLGVHEEAASISPRGKKPLEAGMLLSNEPGYYKTDGYGIRIENLVLVVEKGKNHDTGEVILGFETVSFAPIDRRLIVTEMLGDAEKEWLNTYHG
ncbi:MAG: aminopeptidase P family protein, partial [Micavibrio sp.]|nr:aminopeptidase P family protein [Micavibrio sp.]